MQLIKVSYKNLKITFNNYRYIWNFQITFNRFTFTPYCDLKYKAKNTNGQSNSQAENKLKMT